MRREATEAAVKPQGIKRVAKDREARANPASDGRPENRARAEAKASPRTETSSARRKAPKNSKFRENAGRNASPESWRRKRTRKSSSFDAPPKRADRARMRRAGPRRPFTRS